MSETCTFEELKEFLIKENKIIDNPSPEDYDTQYWGRCIIAGDTGYTPEIDLFPNMLNITKTNLLVVNGTLSTWSRGNTHYLACKTVTPKKY